MNSNSGRIAGKEWHRIPEADAPLLTALQHWIPQYLTSNVGRTTNILNMFCSLVY